MLEKYMRMQILVSYSHAYFKGDLNARKRAQYILNGAVCEQSLRWMFC